MMIGHFTFGDGRYDGRIQTLSFTCDAVILPSPTGELRVVFDEMEIGAAWKDGETDLIVKLDDPFLLAPLLCRLVFTNDNSYVLVWERPSETWEKRLIDLTKLPQGD